MVESSATSITTAQTPNTASKVWRVPRTGDAEAAELLLEGEGGDEAGALSDISL
ncbi:hypothetical protein GCM10023144_33500 [Pigmentiphaga soli]|uniref:Uncharacterized protein n=1 Tax=Pigmentiphaga soli TaxID=1007095 RepID=A0ABP8HD25_9BURK